jgi:AcrR family transcriptional regulator
MVGDVRVTLDDHVLDAVARILDREGVAGLNISAIAAEAGLSRVTLHRRGARLDDYLVAVLGRVSDDLRASLWPAMTGAGPAAERLAAALRSLCEVCERHAGVMSAMYGRRPRPLPGRPGRTTSFEFIEPFERLLRDGNVDGSLHSADPGRDATLTANMVCWTYLHMRQAHRWDAETAASQVVPAAVAHLRPPAAQDDRSTRPVTET